MKRPNSIELDLGRGQYRPTCVENLRDGCLGRELCAQTRGYGGRPVDRPEALEYMGLEEGMAITDINPTRSSSAHAPIPG